MKEAINFIVPKQETYYLSVNSTIRQVLEKMDFYKFTVVPVVNDDGTYFGTVSEGDILRYIKNNTSFDLYEAESVKIKDIDRYRSYKPLKIDTTFDELVKLSLDQNFIPLIDDRMMYIGIVKRKDILYEMYDLRKK